jgi:hypothetical protein
LAAWALRAVLPLCSRYRSDTHHRVGKVPYRLHQTRFFIEHGRIHALTVSQGNV